MATGTVTSSDGSYVEQSTWLWGFMQYHFERRLNAEPRVTFSGDVWDMKPNEAAFVIAVRCMSYGHYPGDSHLIRFLCSPSEPPRLCRLLSNPRTRVSCPSVSP
jgi:hypothetical protein